MSLLILALCLLLEGSNGLGVYIKELTIYKTHEGGFLANSKPEVYFTCLDDRTRVWLDDVIDTNKKYTFGPEEIPATHVDVGKCVQCSLKEADVLDSDDLFGQVTICADDLSDGETEAFVDGEFKMKLVCPECRMAYEKKSNSASASAYAEVGTHSTAVNEGGSKEQLSAGGLVFLCLAVFAIGVGVGVALLMIRGGYIEKMERTRMRDLNAILSQNDDPFEALPDVGKKKSGDGSYRRLPVEDSN